MPLLSKVGAWLREVAAAGALCLTGDLAQHAVQLLDLSPTVKQSLTVLVSRLSYETEYTYPSYVTFGRWCGTKRRAAVDRVEVLKGLRLDVHGVAVFVDPRWKSTMRLDPGDRVRSNRYYVVFSREIVAAAGARFGRVPGSRAAAPVAPSRTPAEAPAPPSPAPSSPSRAPLPPRPVVAARKPAEPAAPEQGARVSASEEAPRAPELTCRAETPEERQVREAMLAAPETADFVTKFGGDGVAAWWGTAQKAKKPLAIAVAALRDTALKSDPRESLTARWGRGVAFLLAFDPKKAREAAETPRLAAKARKHAEEQKEKASRVRLTREAAARLQELGFVAPRQVAAPRSKDEEVADARRKALESLARWEREQGPPGGAPPE